MLVNGSEILHSEPSDQVHRLRFDLKVLVSFVKAATFFHSFVSVIGISRYSDIVHVTVTATVWHLLLWIWSCITAHYPSLLSIVAEQSRSDH